MSVFGPSLRSIASSSFSALARRSVALASSSRLPATAVASFRRSSSSTSIPPPPPPPPSPTPKPQKPLELPRLKNEPTQDQVRTRGLVGVFDWKTALIFVSVGGGLYFYFENEKAKVAELKAQEKKRQSTKSGKPLIGGPFHLVDQDGKEFTEKDLLGQWTLMYFGFTNCPDICPEELDKMSDVVDILDKKYGPIARPLFVSCDPARDDVPQVKKYISEFHPRTVGLTGPYEHIKHMCKVYRVYFSTPPNAKATDDYLVDHSIYFYLLDPDGTFVDAFGKATTAEEVVEKIDIALEEWKQAAKAAASLAKLESSA